MRLKQYINEEQRYSGHILPDIVWEECKPFIKEAKGVILWRGSERPIEGSYSKVKLKGGRKPRYISKQLHEWLGKELKKMFGWNPRTEGLFCGNKTIAENFNSTIYMIFPVGKNYKYIWVDDTSIYEYYDSKGYETDISDPILVDNIRAELRRYNDRAIHEFPQNNNKEAECILKCKEYYMVKADWEI